MIFSSWKKFFIENELILIDLVLSIFPRIYTYSRG